MAGFPGPTSRRCSRSPSGSGKGALEAPSEVFVAADAQGTSERSAEKEGQKITAVALHDGGGVGGRAGGNRRHTRSAHRNEIGRTIRCDEKPGAFEGDINGAMVAAPGVEPVEA